MKSHENQREQDSHAKNQPEVGQNLERDGLHTRRLIQRSRPVVLGGEMGEKAR
jgi:hypothetical protein